MSTHQLVETKDLFPPAETLHALLYIQIAVLMGGYIIQTLSRFVLLTERNYMPIEGETLVEAWGLE